MYVWPNSFFSVEFRWTINPPAGLLCPRSFRRFPRFIAADGGINFQGLEDGRGDSGYEKDI